MSRTDRIGKVLEIVYAYYLKSGEPIPAFKLVEQVMAIEKVTRDTAMDYINVARNAGDIRFVGNYGYSPGEEPPEVNTRIISTEKTKTMPETLADHERRISEIERVIADMKKGFEKREA